MKQASMPRPQPSWAIQGEPAPRVDSAALPSAVSPAVRGSLVVALLSAAIFWIIAWHGEAAARMAGTWWRSDTFAHGLIIYPCSLWLIWRQRHQLAALPVEPCFAALVPLALAGFGWLLGELGGVEAARQFGLVLMVPMAVWVILGTRIVRAIAFPLAFTVLAVPFGEFLVPILMEYTADFTVAALRMTGIPVYREGLFFTIPSGQWSVVEACSGLRYLIASVTLGLLYAYLTYTSLWRRSLFVVASVLVPIVANWLRAYMIVMIGHLSDMRVAVGVDHLLYGWVFFGVVMLLLFWVGSFWREDDPPSASAASHAKSAAPVRRDAMVVVATVCVAVVAVVGPFYAGVVDARGQDALRTVEAPAAANGWATARSSLPPFRPHYVNARATLQETYEKEGRQVGVFIGYYAHQREGAELIAFGNELVRASDRVWQQLSQRRRALPGARMSVVETRLRSNAGAMVAWHAYWTGNRWTTRKEEVKLRQAFDRLIGRADDAAVVVLYAQTDEPMSDEASRVLGQFLSTMRPEIDGALARAKARVPADWRTAHSRR